ncbi:protein-disulfide isomerase [Synechococcus sp. PCC 7502]|uniref:DsbA family protein n=1 Tax=Synechococcus sp. PCC 7502 TaxID=1173263 RepID=UPI00029FD976|nr:DsbA family protein [Synechococcus sp. PCC 7502]AFY73118.1 protein-disulfide isomerase [Synechococcus sp. PCC 7502]
MNNLWVNLQSKINGIGRSLVLLLMLPLLLWGCGSSTAQADIDPKLESQVLEIIRKNPQVILESVQAYQKAQRDQQSQAQDQILKQIQAKPQAFIQNSPTKGATSQKLILTEFSDFQCPFCAKAHAVVKQFIASRGDRVTLVYKHFPLTNIHPNAEPASLASWAAQQQNKFWEFHDGLFENQSQLGEDLYISLATKLGLNVQKFNSDRQSEAAKQAVNKDVELGKAIGVPGTPFFIINGVPLQPSNDLLTDLENAVKG